MARVTADGSAPIALVTGASQGIGLATVAALSRRGYVVVGCALDDEHLADARGKLPRAELHPVDVTDGAAVEALVAAVSKRHGPITALVNSAGIQRYGTVVETSEAEWDQVLAANLRSMYLVCRAVIPRMAAAGGGAIVNVSSVQALSAQPGAAAYVTSKGAVNALTRALAVDHARESIRVNAVCPGSVDTPMLRWAAALHGGDAADDLVRQWGASHPLGRVACAEEVAEAICYLLSPQASFVTGAALPVDGGLVAALGVVPSAEGGDADV
jgi:NAD(P)-dependent dehydrogenase (short-subunit alcohol dehydrogenase family)